MQQFLSDLLARVVAVDLSKAVSPDLELEEGETLIGELPDALKKAWVVRQELGGELLKQCEAAHKRVIELMTGKLLGNEMKTEDKVFIRQHVLAHKPQELVSSLFWHSIEEAFSEAEATDGAAAIALRKNWQVVATPSRRSMSRIEVIEMGSFRMPSSLAEALGL